MSDKKISASKCFWMVHMNNNHPTIMEHPDLHIQTLRPWLRLFHKGGRDQLEISFHQTEYAFSFMELVDNNIKTVPKMIGDLDDNDRGKYPVKTRGEGIANDEDSYLVRPVAAIKWAMKRKKESEETLQEGTDDDQNPRMSKDDGEDLQQSPKEFLDRLLSHPEEDWVREFLASESFKILNYPPHDREDIDEKHAVGNEIEDGSTKKETRIYLPSESLVSTEEFEAVLKVFLQRRYHYFKIIPPNIEDNVPKGRRTASPYCSPLEHVYLLLHTLYDDALGSTKVLGDPKSSPYPAIIKYYLDLCAAAVHMEAVCHHVMLSRYKLWSVLSSQQSGLQNFSYVDTILLNMFLWITIFVPQGKWRAGFSLSAEEKTAKPGYKEMVEKLRHHIREFVEKRGWKFYNEAYLQYSWLLAELGNTSGYRCPLPYGHIRRLTEPLVTEKRS